MITNVTVTMKNGEPIKYSLKWRLIFFLMDFCYNHFESYVGGSPISWMCDRFYAFINNHLPWTKWSTWLFNQIEPYEGLIVPSSSINEKVLNKII